MSDTKRAADQSTIQTRSMHVQPWQASCARCCACWKPSAAKAWLAKSTGCRQPCQNTTMHLLPSTVTIQTSPEHIAFVRYRQRRTVQRIYGRHTGLVFAVAQRPRSCFTGLLLYFTQETALIPLTQQAGFEAIIRFTSLMEL